MERKLRSTGKWYGEEKPPKKEINPEDNWIPHISRLSDTHNMNVAVSQLKNSVSPPNKSSVFIPKASNQESKAPENPLYLLREFRKQAIQENPDFYKHLIDPQSLPKSNYAENPDDLEYTNELRDKIGGFAKVEHKDQQKLIGTESPQYISQVSAFETQKIKNSSEIGPPVWIRILPLVCRVIETKFNQRGLERAFRDMRDMYNEWVKKVESLIKLELFITKNIKKEAFDELQYQTEQDIMKHELIRQVYRKNLKRIFFDALLDFKTYQQDWIEQVRSTIGKAVVFSMLKRNAHEEKMMRKTAQYYFSRLFSAWKKDTANSIITSNAIADEYANLRMEKLASDILSVLKANAVGNKQDRRREIESLMHYQKVRVFLIFDYWKSLSVKRKKPIDFSRYAGMQAIPIRVTQKKNIEVMEDDVSKVVRSRDLGTTYRLMHPNTKI